MMERLFLLLVFILSINIVNAQDCIDYHFINCVYDKHPFYKVDPPGSKSQLMKPGEEMSLAFYIYQGRDYRITTCSDLYKDQIHLQIFDAEDGSLLLYDNELNEMSQQFEFQVIETRRVRVYVRIKESISEKKQTGLLMAKVERDCVGLLLETMVTRK
jgi:hypothetical protein